jgi:hypothetical protein
MFAVSHFSPRKKLCRPRFAPSHALGEMSVIQQKMAWYLTYPEAAGRSTEDSKDSK